MSGTMRSGVKVGWVKVRGGRLNLATIVFVRRLTEPGQATTACQISVTAPDPSGPTAANDFTGLLSFVYVGDDARKILRQFTL